jgi:hypothetical protein
MDGMAMDSATKRPFSGLFARPRFPGLRAARFHLQSGVHRVPQTGTDSPAKPPAGMGWQIALGLPALVISGLVVVTTIAAWIIYLAAMTGLLAAY